MRELNQVSGRMAKIVACVMLASFVGCASPPPPLEPEPVEKSVVSIAGVKHGPIVVAPDSVVAGQLLRGTVSSQTPSVLVQAVVEESREPIGSMPVSGAERKPREFSFRVPSSASGAILVRAIDKNRLYTDKVVAGGS